jgi:hypothetical protein
MPYRNLIGLKRLTDYPTYTKAQVITEAKRQYELQFGTGFNFVGQQVWATEYPNIFGLIYQASGVNYTYIQMTFDSNRLYRFNATVAGTRPPDPTMVAVGYTMTELI